MKNSFCIIILYCTHNKTPEMLVKPAVKLL